MNELELQLSPLAHMTFDEVKSAAAEDLIAVASILTTRAYEVRAGDMDAFYKAITDDIPKCHEMLAIRQGYRAERREIPATANAALHGTSAGPV